MEEVRAGKAFLEARTVLTETVVQEEPKGPYQS